MLKPFLLVFEVASGPRQAILDFLDTRSEVKNWYAFLPTAIFIVSDRNAYALSKLFRDRFPRRVFVIAEIPKGANDGWLGRDIWEFINNPKSAGRWP